MNMAGKVTKTQCFLLVIGIIFLVAVGHQYRETVGKAAGAPYVVFTRRGGQEDVTPEPLPPVNVNTADVELLQTLDGIGPALAQQIVDYREANGPFSSLDDLVKIKGIGPTTVERFRERAAVEAAVNGDKHTAKEANR